jgi:hypothetical protein
MIHFSFSSLSNGFALDLPGGFIAWSRSERSVRPSLGAELMNK